MMQTLVRGSRGCVGRRAFCEAAETASGVRFGREPPGDADGGSSGSAQRELKPLQVVLDLDECLIHANRELLKTAAIRHPGDLSFFGVGSKNAGGWGARRVEANWVQAALNQQLVCRLPLAGAIPSA